MEVYTFNTKLDYKVLVDNMLHGYALHKIILDKNNKPIDFEYIKVNKQFEKLTGLKSEYIINKKVTDVLPGIKNKKFDWINYYSNIALNNGKDQIEQYFESFNKWFKISLFSPRKYYLVILFDEITERKLNEKRLKQAADIVDNIQLGLQIYHLEDINDDSTLRMVAANPVSEVFTGVKVKDLVGKTLDENFPGLREKNIPQQYADVVRKNAPIELEDIYYNDKRIVMGAYAVKAFPLPDNHMGVTFENITEKKKNEQKIIENQQFTERILNTSPNVIYIYDLVENKNIFSNKNIYRIMGYSAEEIKNMGSQLFDIIMHPDDIECIKNHHFKLSRDYEGKIYKLTYRVKNKDGRWIWFLSSDVVFQRDKNNKPMQILGTATDITERKASEEKIKILQKFADSSTQGLGIARVDFTMCYLNSKLLSLIEEEDPNSLLSKKFTEYVPKRLHGKYKNEVYNGLLKYGTWSCESVILTKSKKEIITYENMFLLNDENGNPQYIATVISDITEQKKIEKELDEHRNNLEALVDRRTKELRESEGKFKSLFYDNYSVMLLVDPETGTIVDANQAACSFYKYSHKAITKMNIREINILSDKEIEIEKQNAKNAKRNHFLFKHKLANGEVKDVEVYCGKVLFEHKELLYSIIHDITDRTQAEKALKKSEKELKTLNAQKDKFFSVIAHDLKSPIGSFVQLTQLIHDRLNNLSSDQLKKFTGNLYQTANSTYNLLQNLLIWSKNQLNRIDIDIELIDLKQLSDEAISNYNESAKSKDITIFNKIKKNTYAYADKNTMLTVFRNLIANSIRFSHRKGEIIISAKEKGQNEYAKNSFIEISISDNGVGISRENLSKLFKIDKSFSTQGTENEKGSGLGLILCKDFIEKNGGKIWVKSEEGKGSTFTFSLKSEPTY